MGLMPLFSASAMGISSNASAKACMAYCSMPDTLSAASATASEHEISADPPPYTMRLSLMRLRVTHMASCRERLVSSMSMWLPPRTNTVTARELLHSSMTSMRSLVVPNDSSFTRPAVPRCSGFNSAKRGQMRAPVAMAMSSSSTPPTQRTAGSLFCSNRWLASSSKPHWQMTRLAPLSLTCFTMVWKYSCSRAARSSYIAADVMSSVCLVLGFGGSNGQVRTHMRASTTSFGICGWLISLSRMMPRMSAVSSILPPGLPSTLIKSKFTSLRSRSATASTALTLISAIWRLCLFTIFELRVVMAVLTSGDVSSAENSTVDAMVARWSTAMADARSKPSAMRTGWMPRSRRCSACSNNAPASTTTPVVPSPISSSWDLDSSTMSFAIWCCTCILDRMVAPSFVMVTSPSGDTSILSMPFGPKDVRNKLDTVRAARMLAFCASKPFNRVFCS
mmetsp:Transcript_5057/g.10697  ORF Transcript_5057/g.10697 Transcript_5057/m.10697 type:complete len:450 (+) Transcript_5057:386-1735(+)